MLDQNLPDPDRSWERVSNVVVMGSGEPMDNYDNLIRFIHLLTDEHGLNISQREILRYLPAVLCPGILNWQRRIYRLRWHYPSCP